MAVMITPLMRASKLRVNSLMAKTAFTSGALNAADRPVGAPANASLCSRSTPRMVRSRAGWKCRRLSISDAPTWIVVPPRPMDDAAENGQE